MAADAEAIWSELLDVARRDGNPLDTIVTGGPTVWRALDAVATHVAEGYRDREIQEIRIDHERRRAVVRELLAGGTVSARVLLELFGRTGDTALVLVGKACRRPRCSAEACAAGQPGVAAHRRMAHRPAIWNSDLEAAMDRALRPSGHLVVASAPVAFGPSLPRALDVVLVASPAAKWKPGACGLVRPWGDVASTLVGADVEAVRAALGPPLERLEALSPARRRTLPDTVDAVERADGNVVDAGGLLGCHRNTVALRLQQFEAVTSFHPSTPSGAVWTALAVSLLRSE